MNNKQINSVITLSWITQGISQTISSLGNLGDDIIEQFKGELVKINPNLTHVVGFKFSLFACRDESVSYAMAAQKCKDLGLREEECPEVGNAEAALISCLMKELDDMGGRIKDLLGRITPPEVTPRPV